MLSASGLTADGGSGSPLSDTDVPPAKTRPDLPSMPKPGTERAQGPAWIFQYRTEAGWKKGRARPLEIVQWFEDGMLPDEFYLARPGQKTCRHFRAFPEFRDLRRRPKPTPKKPRGQLRLFGMGFGLALLTTAYASTVLHILCGAG